MKTQFIAIATILLLTSCAIHNGTISSSPMSRNVKYEDIAYGISQTTHILGFGGLSKDALVLEAKRELIKNRPLGPNEQYLNFTVDFERKYFPLYMQTKVTLSADVVKFTKDSVSDPYTDKYKKKFLGKNLTNELFEVGDSIVFSRSRVATIISVEGMEKVRILYQSKAQKYRTKTISVYKIYSKNKKYNGFKSGDPYWDPSRPVDQENNKAGKVLGVGLKKVLVLYYSKSHEEDIQEIRFEK